MNKPLLVGITGGIGSGKSTISEFFKLLGVPVYDADTRAKVLMTEDINLVASIKSSFGNESYVNGELNRQFLAEKVFADSKETLKLNSLVHPAVGRDFSTWVGHQKTSYVLKEAALLFESGSYKELDTTIVVTAPEQMRIERVQKRDPQRSLGQIESIIKRQLNQDETVKMADEEIINDGSVLLIPQVLGIHNKIKKAIR